MIEVGEVAPVVDDSLSSVSENQTRASAEYLKGRPLGGHAAQFERIAHDVI